MNGLWFYGFVGEREKGIVEGIADSGCSESGFNVKGLFVYAFVGGKKRRLKKRDNGGRGGGGWGR